MTGATTPVMDRSVARARMRFIVQNRVSFSNLASTLKVQACCSSLQDWESTLEADLAKTTVSRRPTTKSGSQEPVKNTKKAAPRTEVLAIMSLREQSHFYV